MVYFGAYTQKPLFLCIFTLAPSDELVIKTIA